MVGCYRKVFHVDPTQPFTSLHTKKKQPTVEQASNKVEQGLLSIVGQETAKKRLKRIAVNALMRYDHNCNGINLLLTGPASVGKTSMVQTFAKILDLPYLEINPRSLNSLDDLFDQIAKALKNSNPSMPLEKFGDVENQIYMASPMVVFVDESHALNKQLQDGLLKAIENNDRTLQTESNRTLLCKNICWIFATTEIGDMFGPLLSRFTILDLIPYTKEEIAKIIFCRFPNLPVDVCLSIANFENRVPRKAIDFAKEVIIEHENDPTRNMQDIVSQIAEESGYDELGLHHRHVKLLKLLSKSPMSKDRLAFSLQVGKEELQKMIIPAISAETEEYSALVTVTSKGYTITEAGMMELAKRNLLA